MQLHYVEKKCPQGWHDKESSENYFPLFVFDKLTVLIWHTYYVDDIKLNDIISCFKREDLILRYFRSWVMMDRKKKN